MKNALLTNNEVEANRFVSKVMRVTTIFFSLVLLLNIVGIFKIDFSIIIPAFILGVICLWIPTILINVLKIQKSYVKYATVICSVFFTSICAYALSFHAVLLYVYPIALSSIYFSKKVSMTSMISSVVALSIAQYLGWVVGTVEDDNFQVQYELIVYGILPRAIVLLTVSSIFIVLNLRTTKLLSSVMSAEEQTKILHNLTKVTDKSSQVSEKLVKAVDSLANTSDLTANINQQIVSSTGAVKEGSAETLNQLNVASNNIMEISENMDKLAEESELLADLSERVSSLTGENSNNMEQAIKGMKNIEESTATSKKAIYELEEKSQEIIQIVEVITSISSQTNLLALNAAIESARAGEQGRGFAVVADEIRKLAEQTQSAVANIGNIITEVVESTGKAARAMDESSQFTSEGVQIITGAENSSKQINTAGMQMNEKISAMNDHAKAVAERSNTLVKIVEAVHEISSKNLNDLQNVADATQNEVGNIENLVSLVEQIKDMANDLK